MNSHQITIGIDEVGRGPLAGPLCVSAVALDMDGAYEGLDDSKKLSPKKRAALEPYIKQVALGIGIGWVDATVIDKLGMSVALQLAARRAYDQLPDSVKDSANQIVIDGDLPMIDDPRALTMIKADAKIQAVSAASIIAKEARDSYMRQIDKLYPNYGFARHVGYGTAAHCQALEYYGIIPGIHRTSFGPVSRILGVPVIKHHRKKIDDTIGRRAEQAATEYLISQGYEVIERNWHTKVCEIDIVARKGKELCFVEVKYRRNNNHGDGLAAITPEKLRRMRFGADVYLNCRTDLKQICAPSLRVISMSGKPPSVVDFITIDQWS